MHGRDDVRGDRGFEQLSALPSHAECLAEERLRGGRTQADDNFRLHQPYLAIQPRTARLNLGRSGLLVNPSLATFGGRPLEVFHHVGDIYLIALDARFLQAFVE